jgi:pyrimidine operon attenuation protein / uracil phosphoribosyltransferase
MNGAEIQAALDRLAGEIAARARAAGAADSLAIVGIRRGGVHLAARLRVALARSSR